MKKYFLIIGASVLLQTLRAQQPIPNLNYVDPTIGGVGWLLEPTRPTMHLPNSMIRVYPQRKDQLDDQIQYFPLTMYSHRIGNVFAIAPYTGSVTPKSWTEKFPYDLEKPTPYYYSVRFENNDIKVEFSPAEHSGYYRFTYAANAPKWIRLGIINKEGALSFNDKRVVTGTEVFHGMKAYLYGEFNTDIAKVKFKDTSDKRNVFIGVADHVQAVDFRYSISFISAEQAKENLQKEIKDWNIDIVKSNALQQWNQAMGVIDVQGGTEAQKRAFYTALYRTYERMVNVSEYGIYFSAYDHQVHTDSRPFYVDNWIWDMYLADEPLHTLINPEKEADKIASYVRMYEQSGWMPSFALVFGDNPCMTGNHVAAWVADAWAKGVHNFDLKKAFEGLKKNSLQATLLPWRNGPATSLDSFYNQHGYMPALKPEEKETVSEVHSFERRQAVSVTLENSYDDWCIAQIASALGKEADKNLFLKRAGYYKNVF
ncbi:MAG TPA: GH92 family glycosyl hydrolase, partial [Flavisolibacter sp.]|nr:GH92 family glycosyl hydrolase [Flavisolibacter sp.]